MAYDDWKLASPPSYDLPDEPEEVQILDSVLDYLEKQPEDENDSIGDAINIVYAAQERVRNVYCCPGCGAYGQKGYCSKNCYQGRDL